MKLHRKPLVEARSKARLASLGKQLWDHVAATCCNFGLSVKCMSCCFVTIGYYFRQALYGGALGAVRVQCARSATIWASGRTRDPYFEILGAPRGIMVTPSGGFDF